MFNNAVDVATFGDQTVVDFRLSAQEVWLLECRLGQNWPLGVIKIEFVAIKQVHVGLPQTLYCTNVLPVALETVTEHTAALFEHFWDDVFTKVLGGRWVLFVQDEFSAEYFPLEDVDTHACCVGFWLLGFFLEGNNFALGIRFQNTKAGCLLWINRNHRDGDISIVFLVELQHVVVFHLVDVVAGQNKNVFGSEFVDKLDVLVDGICCALVPLAFVFAHVWGQNVHTTIIYVQVPALAVTNVRVEFQWLVLC